MSSSSKQIEAITKITRLKDKCTQVRLVAEHISSKVKHCKRKRTQTHSIPKLQLERIGPTWIRRMRIWRLLASAHLTSKGGRHPWDSVDLLEMSTINLLHQTISARVSKSKVLIHTIPGITAIIQARNLAPQPKFKAVYKSLANLSAQTTHQRLE